MECISLNLSNGVSVQFYADIPLDNKSIVTYINNRGENIEFTIIDGDVEYTKTNLKSYLQTNLDKIVIAESKDLSVNLIGNYRFEDTYPDLVSSDYNVQKVSDQTFISKRIFATEARISSICNESDLDIVEKIFYVYNQIKSGNKAFATLVQTLSTSNDVYKALEEISNLYPDKLTILLSKVPSKYESETITYQNKHYILIKGQWFDEAQQKVQDDIALWDMYLKRPDFIKIHPITVATLVNYKLANDTVAITPSGNKLVWKNNQFQNMYDEIATDDTVIIKLNKIVDSKLLDRELKFRPEISNTKIQFIIHSLLSDYINDDVRFSKWGAPSISGGIVTLKPTYPANTHLAEIVVPVVLNSYVKVQPGLFFVIDGQIEPIQTVLDGLIDFYKNNDDSILQGIDDPTQLEPIMKLIDSVLDNVSLEEFEDVHSLSAVTVGDSILKRLEQDGKLINYCVI